VALAAAFAWGPGCGESGGGGTEPDAAPILAAPPDSGARDGGVEARGALRAQRRRVEVTDGVELASSTAARGRALLTGAGLGVVRSTARPPRVFVERRARSTGRDGDIVLFDPSATQPLAEGIVTLGAVSEAAGVARVAVGEPPAPALVRLADGAVLRPTPHGRDGAPLDAPVIVVEDGSPVVLVFARAADGSTRYGPWVDTTATGVTLDHESPVHPLAATWDATTGTYEVHHGWGTPGRPGTEGETCVRARTPAAGGATCIAWGSPAAERPSDFEQAWLTRGWVTESSSGYTMALDTVTGERQWLAPPSCPARLAAVLRTPPRVLVGCVGSGSRRTYSIWRPRASVLFDVERSDAAGFDGVGSVTRPILPATVLDRGLVEATYWVDLERGEVVDSAPLRPLAPGSLPRLTLAARRAGGRLQLVRLDFDDGSFRGIATYADCEHDLRLLDDRGSRFAIACARERVGGAGWDVLWSEVVDLEAARRWRTSARVEALLPDDVVIASERDGAANGGAPDRGASELFLLELAP
jgi:hypothetical protein